MFSLLQTCVHLHATWFSCLPHWWGPVNIELILLPIFIIIENSVLWLMPVWNKILQSDLFNRFSIFLLLCSLSSPFVTTPWWEQGEGAVKTLNEMCYLTWHHKLCPEPGRWLKPTAEWCILMGSSEVCLWASLSCSSLVHKDVSLFWEFTGYSFHSTGSPVLTRSSRCWSVQLSIALRIRTLSLHLVHRKQSFTSLFKSLPGQAYSQRNNDSPGPIPKQLDSKLSFSWLPRYESDLRPLCLSAVEGPTC